MTGTITAIAVALISAAAVIFGQMPLWDRKRHDIKRNIELSKELAEDSSGRKMLNMLIERQVDDYVRYRRRRELMGSRWFDVTQFLILLVAGSAVVGAIVVATTHVDNPDGQGIPSSPLLTAAIFGMAGVLWAFVMLRFAVSTLRVRRSRKHSKRHADLMEGMDRRREETQERLLDLRDKYGEERTRELEDLYGIDIDP